MNSFSFDQYRHLIGILAGVSVFWQSVELLCLKNDLKEGGIWSWRALSPSFASWPLGLGNLMGAFLADRPFFVWVMVQSFSAIVLIFAGGLIPALICLFTVYLVSLRFRGTFNGGSDYMTFLTLGCLSLSFLPKALAQPGPEPASVWIEAPIIFLGVETILSYCLSGLSKIKSESWRTGLEIGNYLNRTGYLVSPFIKNKSKGVFFTLLVSWFIMGFEVSFPLAMLNPTLLIFFLIAGVIFHLQTFCTIGLNRFFWAWIAAYPAVVFLAQRIWNG